MNVVYYQRPKPVPTMKWALLVAGMALLVCCVAGALGTVFVRQGIMSAASDVRKFEHDLINMQRRNNYLASKIARAHTPEYLVSKASKELSLPKKDHVVWVQPGSGKKLHDLNGRGSAILADQVKLAYAHKTHLDKNHSLN
jgi:hypothetical protein